MNSEGMDSHTGSETATKHGNGKGDARTAQQALSQLPVPETAQAPLHSPVREDVDIKGRTLWLTRMPYGGFTRIRNAVTNGRCSPVFRIPSAPWRRKLMTTRALTAR